jgi:hypothetical protein
MTARIKSPEHAGPEDESSQQQQQQQQQQQSQSDMPQLRLQPYRVSLFMQRTFKAMIAYNLQPFAAITSDMPVHLIGPSLLRDPLFVNKGVVGSSNNTDASNSQPNSAQQYRPETPASSPQPAQLSTASQMFGKPFSPAYGSAFSDMPQRESAFLQQRHQLFNYENERLGAWQSDDALSSDRSSAGSTSDEERDSSNFGSRQRHGDEKTDADLDLLLARVFGATPAEVSSSYETTADNVFSTSGQKAQPVHYEKMEDAVRLKVRKEERETEQ